MKKHVISYICVWVCMCTISTFALIEGFYKDVFDDEGTNISGKDLKIDCEYINFTFEHLVTSSNKTKQAEIMIKNEHDDNGYLLYPDGQPRFAIVYYHGGYMSHATDLGKEGKERVRQHYYNGGSQFGSCAGSYMLASGGNYFKIWPGKMNGPNISSTPVDKLIPEGSPLIGYCNFKAGDIVKAVRHNNGGSVNIKKIPEGTVITDIHNSEKLKGYGATWAWKDNDTTGRALGITGHPEGVKKEDQIRLMAAYMLYLRDGLGKPKLKHTLTNNTPLTMDKETKDQAPLYTKIGDKQYHHFKIGCTQAKNVIITVNGLEGYDFHLFVAKDTFAFKQAAKFADTTNGSTKKINISALEKGNWYVGVKLATTVKSNQETHDRKDKFIEYSGKIEVLNGIAYTIKAEWNPINTIATKHTDFHSIAMITHKSTGAIHITTGNSSLTKLQIFDLQGKLYWTTHGNQVLKQKQYIWKPPSDGMYIIRFISYNRSVSKSITILK